jgi:hypothetical protein
MGTMVLSNQNKRSEVYDPIRQKWVSATPEEKIRQSLLQQMLSLGFPRAFLTVERTLLSKLLNPHLPSLKRRTDVLSFFLKKDAMPPLRPLLLIECKRGVINEKALDQVKGYNYHLQAPFIAIAGEKSFLLSSWNQTFILNYLPSFENLCRGL